MIKQLQRMLASKLEAVEERHEAIIEQKVT